MKPSDGGRFVLLLFLYNIMIGIYGIFRKSDDKCMYVGQSKDINGRIKHHLNRANSPFNSDEYYGEMIEQHFIDNKQYRLDREAYWINELNAEMNVVRDRHHATSEETKKKIGYANKGKDPWNKGKIDIFSEESRKKISINHSDVSGENNPMYGKHQPEAAKKKIGDIHRGRKYINNGTINKMVKPNELQQYLDNGWKFGIIKNKCH